MLPALLGAPLPEQLLRNARPTVVRFARRVAREPTAAGEIGEVRSLRVVEAHAPMLLDAGALVIIKLPGGVEQSRFLRG